MTINQYSQPIGEALPNFSLGGMPTIKVLEGVYCRSGHLSVEKHLDNLSEFHPEANINPADRTYLLLSPLKDEKELRTLLIKQEASTDPYYFSIISKETGKTIGTLSLMRIESKYRAIEIGAVTYSGILKHTRVATEAQYLLARYVFEILQYRRYEWKYDSLNMSPCRAAECLELMYEGTFRRAVVYKGRSRDTVWFSMIDKEWAHNKRSFERWLLKDNLDSQGKQKQSLRTIRQLAN